MAEFTDLSNVIRKATTSGSFEHLFIFKDSRYGTASAAVPATVAGRFTSLWNWNGYPAAGQTGSLGNGSIPDRLTTGSLYQSANSGSSDKWLVGFTGTSLNAGTIILYDRLWHNSGFNGTLTTSQSVTTPALTRNTASYQGNQIYLEVYDLIGTTATTVQIEYTNQDNVSNRISPPTPVGGTGLREVQRAIQIPLQSGDNGVRSIQNFKLTGTTGTAGNIGLTIIKPIAILPLGLPGVGAARDLIAGLPGPVKIESGSCLAMYWLANGTTAPIIHAQLDFLDN